MESLWTDLAMEKINYSQYVAMIRLQTRLNPDVNNTLFVSVLVVGYIMEFSVGFEKVRFASVRFGGS